MRERATQTKCLLGVARHLGLRKFLGGRQHLRAGAIARVNPRGRDLWATSFRLQNTTPPTVAGRWYPCGYAAFWAICGVCGTLASGRHALPESRPVAQQHAYLLVVHSVTDRMTICGGGYGIQVITVIPLPPSRPRSGPPRPAYI